MRFKKWLASLLVLCMILSLMPLTALANHAVFNDIYCSESVNLMNGWYEMTIQNQEGVNSENIPTYKFKPDPDVQHSINSIDPPLITVQTLAGTQTVETFPQIEEGAQIDLTVHPSSGYSIKFINALYTNLDKNINKQDMTNSSFEGFISYSNNGYTQELVFDMPSDVGDYFISIDPAFKKIPYNVTVDSNIEFGSVSASVTRTGGENEYSDFTLGSQAGINDIVTLTVTPDEGYVLDCLKYNNNEITAFGGVYSFTMPAGDVTVTAEFKADEHNYIHHPATVPEYNAVTGVYTDGNIDYYYCTECGKNFTYNPDTLTYSEYTGSLVVPYFEINDNGTYVRVMKYNGEDSEITVPDTVPDNYYKTELRGKNITSVNQSAFKNNEVIEKVTLGDNITHIGWEAFRGALSLEEVEIGSGLRTLDSFAFADCPSLEKFTCTATQGSITVTSYPFDEGAVRGVVFYGYHSGSFRTAVNKTSFNNHEDITYIGIDDHTAPNWSWSNDFSTATATFDCGNCDYASGPLNATVTSENVEDEFGVHREFTAEVTVDGITYSDTVNGGDFNVITYRVVNGAWSDGSTQDIIEYVPDGGAPEHIPTGMLPASGYEYGSWDGYPESIYEIYNDITFTYTFNPIEYKLWVGGVRVNPTNASDILGDGTAVYEGDSSSGTLTLTDAYITGSYIFLNMSGDYRLDAGIYASGIDLTICLEGENLVGMNNPYAGIVVGENGTLTFEGSGSLVSNGTTYGIWNILAGVTVNSGSVSGICNNGDGVSADTITVNGGSLTGEATGDNPNNDSIYSSEGFTFASGYGVVYPAGGQVGTDLNNHFVIQDENGETVTKAVLGDISVKYNLWVGGVRVDSANASDILGDGSAVYEGDSSSGTLTLTDAEITGSYVFLVMSGDYRLNTDIYVAGIDLTICLVGDSTVGTDNPYAGIVVGVNGTLTFEGSGSLVSSGRIYGIWNDLAGITVNSGSVSGICNNGDGVSADTITVNGGSLTGEATGDNPNNDSIYSSEGFTFASGYGVVYPAGGQVGTDLNNHFVIQDENGETVTKAVLGDISVKYNLWVGGVRVDSANASDILGDGSAVYEGDSSSGTLTLTDAEITGSYVFLVMSGDYRLNTDIYVAGIDLTICLVGDSTVGTDNPYAGIVVGVNGTLTFEGSGSLVSSGRIYGIWNDLAGITVNSGSVSGICNNGDGVSADTITVNGGSLTGEATGDNPNNDSIYSSEGFTFASGYGVVYPAGGQVGTDLNNHFVIQDENGETVTKAVLGELPRIPVTVEFGANHGDYAADNFGTLDGVTVNGTQITYYVPAGTTVTSARGAFMDMLLYYNETIGISLPRDIPKYDAGEYFMRDVALNPASEYTESSFYDELTGDYYKTEIPAEGILFYAQWAQPAGMVEVTVIPPVVGTEIGVSGTGALVRSNPPVEAAVTGNAVLDTHSARNWTNSDFSGYYSGTVTEGQLCYAGFNVNPAYGYYFYVMDDNGDVQFANGTSVIVKNDSNATFTPIDTLEGVKIKATVKAVDPVIFVGAHSLSLDGDIGVNFYASIPGVTDAAYAEFTVDSETVIVPVALNKTAVQDGVTLYKFTCRVHSPQIDTPITGKIVNGSSESETFTYSVQEYLTEAQQTMADNTKFMALASALATYGYNANELFDYNPDFTQHNLYDDRGFAAVNASALADYAADFTNSEGGVDYYGSSLVLRTKTAIRHYFTLPEGRTIDDYTFVLGEGENAVELKPVAKGSLYFIEISNVGSGDLGKAYTVTVYESGTVVNTWTYSALSYVYQVLALYEAGDSSFTEELANTVKALALYYQAADAYFSEINP